MSTILSWGPEVLLQRQDRLLFSDSESLGNRPVALVKQTPTFAMHEAKHCCLETGSFVFLETKLNPCLPRFKLDPFLSVDETEEDNLPPHAQRMRPDPVNNNGFPVTMETNHTIPRLLSWNPARRATIVLTVLSAVPSLGRLQCRVKIDS